MTRCEKRKASKSEAPLWHLRALVNQRTALCFDIRCLLLFSHHMPKLNQSQHCKAFERTALGKSFDETIADALSNSIVVGKAALGAELPGAHSSVNSPHENDLQRFGWQCYAIRSVYLCCYDPSLQVISHSSQGLKPHKRLRSQIWIALVGLPRLCFERRGSSKPSSPSSAASALPQSPRV
jgi:hypothetical protein